MNVCNTESNNLIALVADYFHQKEDLWSRKDTQVLFLPYTAYTQSNLEKIAAVGINLDTRPKQKLTPRCAGRTQRQYCPHSGHDHPTVMLHSSILATAAVSEPFRIYSLIPMRLASYFNLQN